MAINVTKSDRAKALIATGRAQINRANIGKGMFGEKISNKQRLKMTKQGVKDLLKGTIAQNKIEAERKKQAAKNGKK